MSVDSERLSEAPSRLARHGTTGLAESTAALWALLLCSIGAWFFAIRTPLWLDETISYWEISAGFRHIWERQEIIFPAHVYILWAAHLVLGSSEVALRIPSVLATLGAAFLVYRIALRFFARDIAMISAIIFCAHPAVSFAAIDVRPYAFAVLALNCAILFYVRWMSEHRTRDAILFGAASAGILYFHYVFAIILPAFVLLTLMLKWRDLPYLWRDLAKAMAACAFFLIPIVPGFYHVLHGRRTHVFQSATPTPEQLLRNFAPGSMLVFFGIVMMLAVIFRKISVKEEQVAWSRVASPVLALVPIGILYAVSTLTSTHMFLDRYCLAGITGVVLCWGLLLSRIDSRLLRVLFCALLVISVIRAEYSGPVHGHSWKGAIDTANANTAVDHAPVLVCSDLVEGDYEPIPADISSTWLFNQLTYYPLNSRVVPLPRSAGAEAQRRAKDFLQTAVPARQRFLFLAHNASSTVLPWIEATTKDSYKSTVIAIHDGVTVEEFDPR